MRILAHYRSLKKRIAVPIATPSPLVGEGFTAGRHKRGWVRGSLPHNTLPRQPLTRLRFATKGNMCNLYSITTNQAAIIALCRVMNRYVGNRVLIGWTTQCGI
jgi:hypothetical protein